MNLSIPQSTQLTIVASAAIILVTFIALVLRAEYKLRRK